MNFLKNLFGGGKSPASGADKNALYIYVRPKMCPEVLKVRVNLLSDLSRTDDESGFFTRKVVSATRCPFQAEVELHFDGRKQLVNSDVTNGEILSEADYLASVEAKGE